MGLVGDAGSMANMAAKFGALSLVNTGGLKPESLVVPPSVPAPSTSKTVSGRKDYVCPMVSRVGLAAVQAQTTSKAPKHTVAAPKRKKQILPVQIVNKTKHSLPKPPARAPRQKTVKYPSQPLLVSSPGPQDPNQYLCL